MAVRRNDRTKTSAPWYAGGLRFTCTRCGQCCGGAPGYVWLEEDEISRIADYLKIGEDDLRERHCRRIFTRVSLREQHNYDCIYFTPAGCRIYHARPSQCYTFPFWPDNIQTTESWEAVKARCPGAGTGRLYTRAEIEAIRDGGHHTD
ncbi:MAG: YkgJ family cysteine cluster protein [Candidatus Brocadiia bacterium]|nr:YkgJ family cysteine cluster protein [Candidatus Brocadiia bacterium]